MYAIFKEGKSNSCKLKQKKITSENYPNFFENPHKNSETTWT